MSAICVAPSCWDADAEVDGECGQRERQQADDRDRQGERAAAEAAPLAIAELAELRDRRERRLDAGRERHRDGEREDDRRERGMPEPVRGAARRAPRRARSSPRATTTAAAARNVEREGREHQPPEVPEPGHRRHERASPSASGRRQAASAGT